MGRGPLSCAVSDLGRGRGKFGRIGLASGIVIEKRGLNYLELV